MRMITRGRVAVMAMIDVVLCSGNGPVTLTAISRRRKFSPSYLDQLFSKLRQGGLVESSRGPGGGYALARGAEAISVADIMAAVDEDQIDTDAPTGLPRSACGDNVSAGADGVWRDLNSLMVEFLGSVSLQRLVDEQKAIGIPIRDAPIRRGISREPVVKPIRTTAPNSIFALADALGRPSKAVRGREDATASR